MKIKFQHPCDETIYKTRTIPNKGKGKKVEYIGNSITWDFTQWDYYFRLEYIDGGKSVNLFCTSGNPYDCFDWSRVKVEVINK